MAIVSRRNVSKIKSGPKVKSLNSDIINEIKNAEESYLTELFSPPKQLISLYTSIIKKNSNVKLNQLMIVSSKALDGDKTGLLSTIRSSEKCRIWVSKLEVKAFRKANKLELLDWYKRVESLRNRFNFSREKLILNNSWLLKVNVLHYINTVSSSDFSDLYQEAVLGLLRAIDKFNPSLGYTFYTYAMWWIRHYIKRSTLCKDKMIRLPVHLAEKMHLVSKITNEKKSKNNEKLTSTQLSEKLGVSELSAKTLLDGHIKVSSLDAPVNSDSDSSTLVDLISDDGPDQFEILEISRKISLTKEMMGSLSDREKYIIKNRFGIDGFKERDLVDIGNEMGLCRERIRQIEFVARGKMKKHPAALEYQSVRVGERAPARGPLARGRGEVRAL